MNRISISTMFISISIFVINALQEKPVIMINFFCLILFFQGFTAYKKKEKSISKGLSRTVTEKNMQVKPKTDKEVSDFEPPKGIKQ